MAHVDAESGFSGGEVQVFLLIEGLARRGWRNVLFCPPASASAARARASEAPIEVREVAMRNELDGAAILALRRGFAESAVDLVHLHTGRATWLGGWAARLAGVPAITTRRMDRPVRRGWRTKLVYGALVRRAAAISPAVAECLREGGVPDERIVVVPSAVDPDALLPRTPAALVRGALGAHDDDVVVLALGALVPRKGHDVLIEAIERLAARGSMPRVWIAGEGPERAALERLAHEEALDGRVRFLGARGDVGDLLAACDLVAMPSRREGLGVAALEAMAAGRAVVASNVGGLATAVVDGRTGLLVPPDDEEALASALERLVSDRELRERLGRAGPARVREGHLAEQMVDSYERLYREVLDEGSAR